MPNTVSKINGYYLKDTISGYTTNTGTITGVSINGTSIATSGAVNIPLATSSAAGVMSSSDKTKLEGIASGAEVNVQSDWNDTDSGSDAFIKNKPTIPTDTSDLTNGAGFATETYVQNYINALDANNVSY